MSEKNLNQEAFKQAEKELLESKIKEVKGFILETLENIERKKKDKEKIEEELRVLKLDLEDLKQGKFDKIEERRNKSKISRAISVDPSNLVHAIYSGTQALTGTSGSGLTQSLGNWQTYTTGTYLVNYHDSNGVNINKTFYL